MKIQLFSDLHIEFEELDVDCATADVVIFAGDIDVGTKGVAWIKRQKLTCPVIYVLENTALTIDGVTFHGATLWTDFELFGDPKLAGYKCQEIMNDFKVIRRDPSYSRLRTMDAALIHKNTLHWLGRSLEQSRSAKNVVITHHAPSKKSLPEKSKDHIVSAAYASNLEHFINTHKPDYWLHGHIHDSLDYLISDCRVVCNPKGYTKGKCNPNFDPSLIIEL